MPCANWPSLKSLGYFSQQFGGDPQVSGLMPLRKAVVDLLEICLGLGSASACAQQARQTDNRAQFPGERTLRPRLLDRIQKRGFRPGLGVSAAAPGLSFS